MIDLVARGESWHISGELLRNDAELAREVLLGTLGALPTATELDLSELVALDAGGVQLLVALRRSAPGLKLVRPSVPALEVCTRLGAARYLFEAP